MSENEGHAHSHSHGGHGHSHGGHGHSHGGHGHSHGGHGHSHGAHEGVGEQYAQYQSFFDEVEQARKFDEMAELKQTIDMQVDFLQSQDWWANNDKVSVLDFGCGTARLLSSLGSNLGPNSLGVDVAEGMLAIARERIEREGLKDLVELKQINAEENAGELNAYVDSFDMVTCCMVLHHTLKPQVIAERLCRAMKPGARLLIAEFTADIPPDSLREWLAGQGVQVTATKDEVMTFPPMGHRTEPMVCDIYLAVAHKTP